MSLVAGSGGENWQGMATCQNRRENPSMAAGKLSIMCSGAHGGFQHSEP
jgi:hypothetical protein